MWEKYTVQFPEHMPSEALERRTEISKIDNALHAYVAEENRLGNCVRIGFITDRSEYGTVSIFGSLDMAKKIIERTSLKIRNFLTVEIPERDRHESHVSITKNFDKIGKTITGCIEKINAKKLLGTDDAMPTSTEVTTFVIAADTSSVTLYVTGNIELTRHLLTRGAKLKLLD